VDAIDPKLVKSLELHKLTKVESRNRPGQTFELLKIPIELTVACDDLAKTEETKSNMSCASLSFCPWRRGSDGDVALLLSRAPTLGMSLRVLSKDPLRIMPMPRYTCSPPAPRRLHSPSADGAAVPAASSRCCGPGTL